MCILASLEVQMVSVSYTVEIVIQGCIIILNFNPLEYKFRPAGSVIMGAKFDLFFLYVILNRVYDIVSWDPERRYQYSTMFRWEPEGRCTKAILLLNGTSLYSVNAFLVLGLGKRYRRVPCNQCGWRWTPQWPSIDCPCCLSRSSRGRSTPDSTSASLRRRGRRTTSR